MAELLFEVFCEEIPARMQAPAVTAWEEQASALFAEEGLSFDHLQAFITPRRLTLWVKGLPQKQLPQTEERRGPRLDAPPAALEGFLKSVGQTKEQCHQRETPKGIFWVATLTHESQKTAERIPSICRRLLTQFAWPKSMRWGHSQQTWVRPIRHLLCLFEGKPLPWIFDAQGGVLIAADAQTQGHRFLKGQSFVVGSFEDYIQKLEKSFVILDRSKRRQRIQTAVQNLATAQGLHILPEDFEEGALLDEVTGLVEWPVGFLGKIDARFMSLPEEVLTTPMRVHQRYFPLRDPHTHKLAPFFVVIANTQTEDGGEKIIAGNERVLRARLSDAQFFWEQDLKKSLTQHGEQLHQRVFFQDLGTLADKVLRLKELALFWAPRDPLLEQAASLCKADLSSEMVGEFPELQGIMGMHYARQEGLTEDVAVAIRDHYWPQGIKHEEPSPLGCALGIIDRIDTLVGFFALGLAPTGSKDPMGLRRAGFGLVQLILQYPGTLALKDFFQKAFETYRKQGLLQDSISRSNLSLQVLPGSSDLSMTAREERFQEKTIEALLSFVEERFKHLLREKEKLPYDQIDAILATKTEDGFQKQAQRVRELNTFLSSPHGEQALSVYRRIASLLRAEEKKDGLLYQGSSLRKTLLKLPEEKALAAALDTSPLFHAHSEEAQLKALATIRPLTSSLKALAALRPPIDTFFEAVTVNDPDKAIRHNRLALLAKIRGALEGMVDFSKLEG